MVDDPLIRFLLTSGTCRTSLRVRVFPDVIFNSTSRFHTSNNRKTQLMKTESVYDLEKLIATTNTI
ncbi:hypothetical protein Prudu_021866 [Prunus dulcis]|uniref:Uncharacterized protein n=1 Tax=Prunus dulcis TaxID=3755 RepID=A0A4Y1S079_PRUDU|nr:hypothetical protein Prudu_021866 [Prunus dulcis]